MTLHYNLQCSRTDQTDNTQFLCMMSYILIRMSTGVQRQW